MTTKTVIDSEGPAILWSDGTRTTPLWGPGALVCGHVVEIEHDGDGDWVQDIIGDRICIECWNRNARRRG